MPSVSNIAVGGALASAAADKARHGMNESIARLSTGVRAMYGGDAAGHSVGTVLVAKSKSFSAAVRNIEDGISMLQQSESLLLEVANLLTRGRELGIQDDGLTSALGDSNQIAAANAEITVITDTVLHRAQLIHPTSRDLNTSHEHDRLACRLGDPGPNEAY